MKNQNILEILGDEYKNNDCIKKKKKQLKDILKLVQNLSKEI